MATVNDGNGGIALIVGGGPGISSSCARLFTQNGMRVAVAARTPDKPVLVALAAKFDVRNYTCDAADADAVSTLFDSVTADLGSPTLVVHNIDGRMADIFRKSITEADPDLVRQVMMNSAYSAFLVAQQAAKRMLAGPARRRRRRPAWHDHLHQRQRRDEGLSPERRLRDGLSGQVGFVGKHGARTHAARHSRCQRPHRRGDRLDASRWDTRASDGRDVGRRQHGRSRPHRGYVPAPAPTASLDLGIRSRAAAVGRELVTAGARTPTSAFPGTRFEQRTAGRWPACPAV